MNSTDGGSGTDAAWEQMAPLIDEALASLSAKDRHAILLRFFQEKSFRDIGVVFGGNENSARLRVVRALEKLRGFFQRRGIVLPAGLLSSALLIPSARAAPDSLTTSVMGTIASGRRAVPTEEITRVILKRFWWRKWLPWGTGLVVALLLTLMVAESARTA
jgi:hypothetical protein